MRTLLKLLRVRQWTKNAFLLLPLLFSGSLLDADALVRNLIGFASFCLIASGVYVFNDLRDRDADRLHPSKCHRPIASGEVSTGAAVAIGSACLAAGVALGVPLGAYFVGMAAAYIANNVLYSLIVKRMPVLDVMSIAIGFVLRVFAGAFATECTLSPWIVLCMFMLSLFLAVEKRRAELKALAGVGGSDAAECGESGKGAGVEPATRSVLGSYTLDALEGMSLITVAITVMSYSLYTFSAASTQYMMATIPFVIYGTFRYLLLAGSSDITESPDRVLLEDKPILVDVLAWALACAVILYIG